MATKAVIFRDRPGVVVLLTAEVQYPPGYVGYVLNPAIQPSTDSILTGLSQLDIAERVTISSLSRILDFDEVLACCEKAFLESIFVYRAGMTNMHSVSSYHR